MDEEKANVQIKNIWQKLSDIQNTKVDIIKDKAAHGYSYATLDQIMDLMSPILHSNGLVLYHQTDWDPIEKMQFLKTTIRDVDDPSNVLTSVTYIDSTIVLPGQNKAMVTGSLITYYRRYHVTSMLGLTTETDNDAGGAPKDGNPKGRSVEAAGGGEKAVDFINIFDNMIKKGKTKEVVSKQFETYKTKMNEEQLKAVEELITKMQ